MEFLSTFFSELVLYETTLKIGRLKMETGLKNFEDASSVYDAVCGRLAEAEKALSNLSNALTQKEDEEEIAELKLKVARLREEMREKWDDLVDEILAYQPELDTGSFLPSRSLQADSRAADLAGANPCNLFDH